MESSRSRELLWECARAIAFFMLNYCGLFGRVEITSGALRAMKRRDSLRIPKAVCSSPCKRKGPSLFLFITHFSFPSFCTECSMERCRLLVSIPPANKGKALF